MSDVPNSPLGAISAIRPRNMAPFVGGETEAKPGPQVEMRAGPEGSWVVYSGGQAKFRGDFDTASRALTAFGIAKAGDTWRMVFPGGRSVIVKWRTGEERRAGTSPIILHEVP